jgi:hypothetical protein
MSFLSTRSDEPTDLAQGVLDEADVVADKVHDADRSVPPLGHTSTLLRTSTIIGNSAQQFVGVSAAWPDSK